MSYFQPDSPAPTDEILQGYYYFITISMANISHLSDTIFHLYRVKSFLFLSNFIGKKEIFHSFFLWNRPLMSGFFLGHYSLNLFKLWANCYLSPHSVHILPLLMSIQQPHSLIPLPWVALLFSLLSGKYLLKKIKERTIS